MNKIVITAATIIAAWPGLSSGASAQEEVRIGVITTLTTPAAVIGRELQDGINLAAEHVGGAIAGKKIKLIFEDDGFNPDLGRQKTDKLIRQDNVDFITGYIWSNVLLASRRSAVDSGKILISANAAPADIAGKLCHPNLYAMRGQGDVMPMALGEELNRRGIKTVYTMAPNYAAGKDVVAGFQRTFKGKIAGQDFTRWGSDPQLDFSAEFAKAAASGAEALFAFYPGRASAFMKQFEQSGLKEKLKLFTVYTVDQIALPSLQEAEVNSALGSVVADYWYPDLEVAENKRFVQDFKAKFGRTPSNYAAAAYDAIPYIKAAVEAVNGNLSDRAGIRQALEKAEFKSVRGQFVQGPNHMPLDNYYALEVATGSDGKWNLKPVATILEKAADPYAGECKMSR